MIHPQAVIDPSAKIADDVEIGPWTMVGADVVIDEGTWVGPHVVIGNHTKVGKHNKIYPFSSVGEAPQHLEYSGEPTSLEIGDHNTIREYCTLNRGTAERGKMGVTRIGDHNFLMAYVHIAHDATIGNHTVFVNGATVAGHVEVGDFATLGAFVGVHQFCKVGAHSFISRAAMIVKDILPYMIVSGTPVSVYGLNKVGLKRRGYTNEQMRLMYRAYQVIYRENKTVDEAISLLGAMLDQDPGVIQMLIDGLRDSSRGILR